MKRLGSVERAAGCDAQQRRVCLGVLGGDVVRVVGRDDRQAEVVLEPQQALADPGLDLKAVLHQLEEEVLLAEDVLELGGRRPGLVVVADAQPGLDLAGRAARRRDEALAVSLQQVTIGTRLAVLPLEARVGADAEQVVHALGRLRQQRHVRVCATARDVVVAALVPLHGLLFRARDVGREVGLHADDRLDPVRLGLGPEVVGAVQVAVIGHRDGRHAAALRSARRARRAERAPSSIEYSVCTCRCTNGESLDIEKWPPRRDRGGRTSA